MAQVFAGDSKQVAALLPVDRGLGGFYVVGGASFDLDKAQDVVVLPNQVDFAATGGRTKITGDHGASAPSKIEIGVFFTAPADTQVLSDVVGRQPPACGPIKDANRGVSKTTGEHWILLAPASRRPDRRAGCPPDSGKATPFVYTI